MRLDWRWLFFQVGIALVAPVLLAAIFAGAELSVDPACSPRRSIGLDVTPWAIVIYSLALIGGTFDRSWKAPSRAELSSLWVAVATYAAYHALLVIRRHAAGFEPAIHTCYVTGLMMVASIVLVHRCRRWETDVPDPQPMPSRQNDALRSPDTVSAAGTVVGAAIDGALARRYG